MGILKNIQTSKPQFQPCWNWLQSLKVRFVSFSLLKICEIVTEWLNIHEENYSWSNATNQHIGDLNTFDCLVSLEHCLPTESSFTTIFSWKRCRRAGWTSLARSVRWPVGSSLSVPSHLDEVFPEDVASSKSWYQIVKFAFITVRMTVAFAIWNTQTFG